MENIQRQPDFTPPPPLPYEWNPLWDSSGGLGGDSKIFSIANSNLVLPRLTPRFPVLTLVLPILLLYC